MGRGRKKKKNNTKFPQQNSERDMQNETIFLKDLNYITYSTGILQVIFEYSNLIVRCVCNLFILIFC